MSEFDYAEVVICESGCVKTFVDGIEVGEPELLMFDYEVRRLKSVVIAEKWNRRHTEWFIG